MASSRYTPIPDAWQLVLAVDENDTNPLTLQLASDDAVALWEGTDRPALSTDQPVPREAAVMWRPQLGAGYSRRTPSTTTVGPDGQIVSAGTAYLENGTLVTPLLALPAGALTSITVPGALTSLAAGVLSSEEYGPYPIVGADKDLYLTTDTRYLIKIAAGTDTATAIDFGVGYTTKSLQIFDGKMYLSGAGNGPVQELSAAVWTAAAAACKAAALGVVNWIPSNSVMGGSGGGTPADHLILVEEAAHGFHHVVTGNDVKVFANWINNAGTPIQIGDLTTTINSLAVSPRVVWFAKTDGLYGYTETGRSVNLTPWMRRAFDTNNGLVSAFYSDEERAFVLIAHAQGLVMVIVNGTQQETARFIPFGTAAGSANDTPIFGRPRAITAHVDGVFVAYYDGADSRIMRLIFEKDGGFRWSGSECTITGEEVTHLRVRTVGGAPQLVIATKLNTSGYPRLYRQSLPVSGDPWVDYQHGLAHRFATSWSAYLPRDDVDSSGLKVERRFDLVARGIGDGNQVAVSAAVDSGAYTAQGTMTEGLRGSFFSPDQQSGSWFNWKLAMTNSTTVPVGVETFQARVAVLPEQMDVWTFRCQLASGQGLENDAIDDIQDPGTVQARLRGLQLAGPIQLLRSPLSRDTLLVKIEQGSRIQSVWSRKDQAYVVILTFSLAVLHADPIYGQDLYGAATYGLEAGA